MQPLKLSSMAAGVLALSYRYRYRASGSLHKCIDAATDLLHLLRAEFLAPLSEHVRVIEHEADTGDVGHFTALILLLKDHHN